MSTNGGFIPPAGAAQDFWRSPAANGVQPDGVADVTEAMARSGPVGVGLAVATAPVSSVDVSNGARSGTHGNVAGSPGYFTGVIDGLANITAATPTPTTGFEVRHSNGTSGLGFAYNGVYATGSNANQDLIFQQRGAGQVSVQHQALLGGFNFFNHGSQVTLAANEGWRERWFAGGVLEAEHWLRRSTVGAGLGNEDFFQRKDENGAIRNALTSNPSVTHPGSHSWTIDAGDTINDAKLVLYGYRQPAFFGFGIKSSTLASFISSNASHWRWYQGASPGTQVFGVSGLGNVTVDPLGVAPSGFASPVLRFGGESSDEAIRSQRIGADRFLEDIEVFTSGARRFAVLSNGRLYAAVVPTFASNAAAVTGGLATGEVFKDATGLLHIVL